MIRKTLYFDVETTGIDSKLHGMIQLACLVDIDGKLEAEKDWFIKPFRGDLINKEAAEVTGISRDDMLTFPEPNIVYREIVELFSGYIGKFDKTDKFYPAGYNVRFDLEFLSRFFEKNGDKYFGSFCNWKAIDPLLWLYRLDWNGLLSLPDYKLATVCEYFGIELGDSAHDALADIKATRELMRMLPCRFSG
jgi:DNA polymerase-3 subunit epsilon